MVRRKFLIVDAHALLHRAFHALPPLTNRQGRPVGAEFGFFSILLSALRKISPSLLAVCFDSPGPTFRHQAFVGYQIKRPEMDERLAEQIKRTREVLQKAKIAVFIKPGFEADDLAATLARKESKKGREVLILTGDKDLMQLVTKRVKLLLLQRQMNEFIVADEKVVEERLGVKPKQVIDYKALAGDSSDNYPGVPGVGPKTARQLLEKYGSFSAIYQHLSQLPASLKKKLEEGREAGELSYQLATIVSQVPLKVKSSSLFWNRKKLLKLKEALKEEGFRALVKRIDNQFGLTTAPKQQLLFK
ncbi:hypothetical protein J7J95_01035 [bacterium]|nr:hypothetical protein [bacterium]